KDILRELKGNIAESSAANGGNMSASLAALGSAREVGHRYRELYGYGTLFKILFSAIAMVLGIVSLPVLLLGTDVAFPLLLSLVFVLAAMSGRLIAFGALVATQPDAITTSGGLSILFAVSSLFVLLGWIPGTAKKAWSAPRAEL